MLTKYSVACIFIKTANFHELRLSDLGISQTTEDCQTKQWRMTQEILANECRLLTVTQHHKL